METNKNNKRIVILGLILLIVAGLIVVSLKGFNVTLMFGSHETVELKVDKPIDMSHVKEICDEIFQNKAYVVKELEVFGDSFQINVKSITDEEKNNLIEKVNEKFETEKTVEDLRIRFVANKRIRDIVRPYVIPMLIVFGIVCLYALIRFRKINSLKLVMTDMGQIILTEIVLLSVIAIVRIPVNDLWINGLLLIAIVEWVYFFGKAEDNLVHKTNENE